jgi:hypothetical protein
MAAPTFGALDAKTIQLRLAQASLTQVFRNATMTQIGATVLGNDPLNQYFDVGDTVTVRRVKDSGAADEYNPRSGSDAPSAEPGYVTGQIVLEKLFTKAYPVYSHDANIASYLSDYAVSTGMAIKKSIDDYFYNRFRTWSLVGSGAENIDVHPPTGVSWKENSSGVLQGFSRDNLLYAGLILDQNEVPSTNRKARIGAVAKTSFLSDAIAVVGEPGAYAGSSPGTSLINTGLPIGTDIYRDGFLVSGSNAVTGQTAVADLGDGDATEPLATAADDTTVFFKGDLATSTPLGAVEFTIDQTAALNAGVAVGKIARIGAGNATAIAYGVILRVTAATKKVWLVPYGPTGNIIPAATFTTSHSFSVPAIREVNVAAHTEALLYASRAILPPSADSGAVSASVFEAQTGLILQVLKGTYQINQFKETIRSAVLLGAKMTDYRKACLMLSA